MIVKDEDILAYWINEDVVCSDCIEAKELRGIKADALITNCEVEGSEYRFFCDRCNEEIKPL